MISARDFPALDLAPALDRPEVLAPPVLAALRGGVAPGALAGPIDPQLSDTAAFCAAYDVGLEQSANCVVLSGKREGQERWAAVVVLASTRADINSVARRRMDVRKVSFAPMDVTASLTGMEYGGVTPIGLPLGWPILLDAAVVAAGPVIIGSGTRAAKIALDGASLADLPGAVVVEGLARPVPGRAR